MREALKYNWLPEEDMAAVLALPDRGNRIVAAATDALDVIVVFGDGTRFTVSHGRFAATDGGQSADFTQARPAVHGRTLQLGAWSCGATFVSLVVEGKLDDLFDPADHDASTPDVHATPEQLAWLDRAVAVAPRVGEPEFSEADGVEWRAVTAGLRATLNMYGCEWIHRGWDLMLHGNMIFADRFTPEYSLTMTAWWDEFLSRPKPKLVTRRLPVADVSCLD